MDGQSALMCYILSKHESLQFDQQSIQMSIRKKDDFIECNIASSMRMN